MALRLFLAAGLTAFVMSAQPALAAPAPKLERTAVVSVVSGTVLVKDRGDRRFHRLPDSPTLVHMGAELDATRGKARVRTAAGKGDAVDDGVFWRGRFEIFQGRRGGVVTELTLTGGDPGVCAASAGAAASAGVERRLWAQADRNFRTRGRSGGAEAVKRGTKWVTEDLCNGTRTAVKRGVVLADVSGQIAWEVAEGQITQHFCDFDGIAPVSQVFCTGVLYAPELGVWGAGVANQGDATSYDLCVTNPAAEERCETYPLSEPYGPQNLRDSVVSCPGDGPGAYSLRWLIDGVQLGPPLGFTLNAPPGQGCLHRP